MLELIQCLKCSSTTCFTELVEELPARYIFKHASERQRLGVPDVRDNTGVTYMFWKALQIPSFAIVVLAAGILFSCPSIGREIGSFEGAWEGKLKVVASSLDNDSESYKRTVGRYEESPFKIIIQGKGAKVFFGDTEVKPNLFQTNVYMTNAVVFASSAGGDADGPWVETWSFLLTQKNPDTLIVCFSRIVNNLDAPETQDFGKFFIVTAGELRRTSR
jgi:hypothetical protein